MNELTGKRIAIVATNGFEYSELTEPKKALEEAGAKTEIISPEKVQILGESKGEIKGSLPVDKTVDEANPEEYDALLLPGGVRNPDRLWLSDAAIQFIKHFVDAGKPIAA